MSDRVHCSACGSTRPCTCSWQNIAGAQAGKQEMERLGAEVEHLRVQLVGCGVAALGAREEAVKDAYGWSPAYADVVSLRAQYDRLRAAMENLCEEIIKSGGNEEYAKSENFPHISSGGARMTNLHKHDASFWIGEIRKALAGED